MDPDRVAVLGYSSGGHLASMLGVADGVPELEPDCAAGTTGAANAVIAGAGIHDLEAMSDDSSVQDFLGGSIAEAPERYRLASPIRHVEAGEPPYLLIHGGSDWVIDEEQSRRMRDALVAAGNEARLMSLEDSGHLLASGPDIGSENFGTVNDRPESWLAVIDFLHETMGPP
jgi:dipeptidyl aminopeptidase/acylaminoacyl peptidase